MKLTEQGQTPQVEWLRLKARALPHAIVRSIAIFPDGRMGEATSLHYLSCVRCATEKLADEIEKKSEVENGESPATPERKKTE